MNNVKYSDLKPNFFTLEDKIKGWGFEKIIDNRPEYAAKILVYNGRKSQSSFHYHSIRRETFMVYKGEFMFEYIDPQTAAKLNQRLKEGDRIHIPPCVPHRLTCLSDGGEVFEVSTMDNPEDNFRIEKGDSQNK